MSNIELFLNYCNRFYDRQFITRETVHKGVLDKFENLINTYINSDISEQLRGASEIRLGGEYKIERLSLRAGYRFEGSPYKD